MMDPRDLYPDGFHPMSQILDAAWTPALAKHSTRTRAPVKYYFIDFGISCAFDPADTEPLAIPIRAGDKSAPDFTDDSLIPINPFPTDVYYIGNLIRMDIMEVQYMCLYGVDCVHLRQDVQQYRRIDFMGPLIEDMVQADPTKRPNMDVVVERFEYIRRSLPWWKLRRRLRLREEDGAPILSFVRDVRQFFHTLCDIVMSHSAIPTCK